MSTCECDFRKLALELGAAIAKAAPSTHVAVLRQWHVYVVEAFGLECWDKVLCIRQLCEDVRQGAFEEGRKEERREMKKANMPKWEKIVWMCFCAAIVGVGLYKIAKNEPFADPNHVVFLRILFACFGGFVGNSLAGMFQLEGTIAGINLKATSALGLAVLFFMFTPTVLQFADSKMQAQPVAPPAVAK